MAQKSVAISVTTAAVVFDAVALAGAFSVSLVNNGPGTLYLGDASVTTSSGLPIPSGASFSFDAREGTVYGVSDSTCDVRRLVGGQ